MPSESISKGTTTLTAGGALLARLKSLGVDYVFANSGTDFPPIIEGLAEGAAKGIGLPEALVMPHEMTAMGMAFGYYLATGRAQAVMAHTNVGLANCAIGAINAATDHVPLLLFSGRTPTTEQGRLGSRTVPIGWGQEMRDQAALVREACKWDYELRFPEQVVELVDRAYAIANSTPKGPVYMSLPREVLCEPCPAHALDARVTMNAATAAPHPADVATAAEILARAERPMIVAQRGAGSRNGFDALARWADLWGIPVVHYWAIRLAIATEHRMHAGGDPEPWITEADAVVVIDSLAPWSPDVHTLRPECKVVQIGPNPLYSRFPVRNFRSDVSIMGETADAIVALEQAMAPYAEEREKALAERRRRVATRNEQTRQQQREAARVSSGQAMSKACVAHALSEAIAERDATVLSELGCPLAPMTLKAPNSWYQEPHSGGLGWSLPSALGVQLAERKRLVIATMGDGSYIFANPVACHQVAEAQGLAVLTLVLNNSEWGAVRHSVLGVYPDGYAAKANEVPLTAIAPSPDYTKVAQASRAWTASVEKKEELPGVLDAAIAHIERERTQAFVEAKVSK